MWKALQARFRSPDSFVSMILGLAVVLVIGTLTYNYITKTKVTTPEEKKKQEAAALQAALPATHTVASGETLWTVAEKYYKSGYNWVSIKEANSLINPDYIEVGQTLTIPNVAPILPQGQVSSASVEAKPATYTVVKGDDLWHVAERYYADGYKWADIARVNNLASPDLIHPGNILTLP